MTLFTSDLNAVEKHHFLQYLIAPRPICFASTIDANGTVNLSPFSFFNLFSTNPPILIFSASRRVRDNTTKHTLQNVLDVPEVAISIVTYDMVHQVSLASCEYPKGTDEFIKAGFTKQKSTLIRPPFVKEAKANFECKVLEVKSLGTDGGAGQLVIAEILCMHIDDSLLDAKNQVDQEKLELVGRLGGDWYTRITPDNLFKVQKPKRNLGIGIDALPALIKNSSILSGNHLGQLANVEHLPEIQKDFRDGRLEALNYYFKGANQQVRVHTYVKELLDDGLVDHAWQVLLSDSNGKEYALSNK